MFDFSWAELILIGIVSMIFIGPKDFPKIVYWFSDVVKKCRGMAREFHSQVDEMVKDPDLKEAKDQLMKLHRMNIKSAILDVIDRDRTLQENLNSPLNQTSIQSPKPYEIPFSNKEPEIIPEYLASTDHKEPDLEALAKKDPAPIFFPPAIAQRLQVKRSAPPVPAMIPPQIVNYREQGWP